MLLSMQTVRDNIRNRDGKRVYYLGRGDQLTSSARDFLQREKIEIIPAEQAMPESYRLLNGAEITEKPEEMTHLRGNILVEKTHPVIAFRGAMDSLESILLLTETEVHESLRQKLQDILNLARQLLRCDVMEEPVKNDRLCGLTQQEQHERSHFPQDYYGQAHFMPEWTDGKTILLLNRCRTAARAAELNAAEAFRDREGICTRPDILRALNRMSSMLYILMIEEKAGGKQ